MTGLLSYDPSTDQEMQSRIQAFGEFDKDCFDF